ncbi:MAG: hypothetical protein WDO16_06710 [Bacteroidota bacterium]
MGPVAGDPKFITPVTNLHPHIIRFPGGSSSDVYFWNAQQGVNPPDAPAMITDENGVKKDPDIIMVKQHLTGNAPWIITTVCCSKQVIRESSLSIMDTPGMVQASTRSGCRTSCRRLGTLRQWPHPIMGNWQ